VPRLDDIQSIPKLQLKAQEDSSASKVIKNIACYAIASIFYFKLTSLPERRNRNYISTGFILYWLRQDDPAFKDLFDKLSKALATFYLNNDPIPRVISDGSFFGGDGNFWKRVELNLNGRFTISLKQSDSEPCNISGSPYLIERLITTQDLDAHFGTADYGKRRRSAGEQSPKKRQRI
jgi:hypothetical protein